MAAENKKKVHNTLNLNYNSDNGVWLHQGKTLRKIVGTAGMLLPILLLVISLTFFELPGPLASISHYYYTRAATLFTIIVSLIGIFLIKVIINTLILRIENTAVYEDIICIGIYVIGRA